MGNDISHAIDKQKFLSRAGRLLCLLCLATLISGAVTPAFPSAQHPPHTVLLKNREYAGALLAAISEARSNILVSCYLFKITNFPGNMPRRIADELISARKRGVHVTVILEQSRDESDFLNRENRSTAAFLTKNGITVHFDSLRKTSHAKVVVIDDRRVFLGSHNLTHNALSRNNELSVRIDSPEMAQEIIKYLRRL